MLLPVGGVVLGLLMGLVGARLADALPARYGITHLVTGSRRRIRNIVVVAIVTMCAFGVGMTIARVSDMERWQALLLLGVHTTVFTALVTGAAIDLEHMILPNELTLGGALICLASSPVRSVGIVDSALGAFVGFLFAYVPFVLYKKLRGRSGMGLGDAKLAILAGAWLGPVGAILVLFFGSALMPLTAITMHVIGVRYPVPASVAAEIAELRKRASEGDAEAKAELADDPMAEPEENVGVGPQGTMAIRMPLGPFLALACLIVFFLRKELDALIRAWLSS